MRIWIPTTLIILGLAGLLTMGIYVGGIPELQVHQALAGEKAGRKVKLHGKIERIVSDVRPIEFVIADKNSAHKETFTVVVDALRPDIFKVGNDVAVEGVYDARAGRMNGTKIYTKCPSKYEASEQLMNQARDPAAPAPEN